MTISDIEKSVQSDDEGYLKGFHHGLIRYYYYLSQGLDVLNQFRNVFLLMFGIYVTLKVTTISVLVGIFVSFVIALTLIGYYNVIKVGKVKEWLNMRFSTFYGIKSFNYSKAQYELLLDIKKLLEERKK